MNCFGAHIFCTFSVGVFGARHIFLCRFGLVSGGKKWSVWRVFFDSIDIS